MIVAILDARLFPIPKPRPVPLYDPTGPIRPLFRAYATWAPPAPAMSRDYAFCKPPPTYRKGKEHGFHRAGIGTGN